MVRLMRPSQCAMFGVCATLLAGCSFEGQPGPDPVRVLGSNQPIAQPETPTGSDPIASMFVKTKSLSGTIDLDSEPAGAEAKTSLSETGCRTPCTMEVSTNGPFSVTFTHENYTPVTVSVHIEHGDHGVSNPKFSPNPVSVQMIPYSARDKSPGVRRRQKDADRR